MVLSSINKTILPNFEFLFTNFGNKNILLELYKKMKKSSEVPNYLINSKFSPHE